MIITAIFGDIRRFDGFESLTTMELLLDAGVARLQASIDGEAVTVNNPLGFRIRPGALRVVVP
jgi:diacylglycerol kinase family enzyme